MTAALKIPNNVHHLNDDRAEGARWMQQIRESLNVPDDQDLRDCYNKLNIRERDAVLIMAGIAKQEGYGYKYARFETLTPRQQQEVVRALSELGGLGERIAGFLRRCRMRDLETLDTFRREETHREHGGSPH